jgi:Skp family chaperone for outer membrane proteins
VNGKRRLLDDHIPEEEWQGVPPKNRLAMLGSAYVTPNPPVIGEAEAALRAQCSTALEEADATRKLFEEIEANLDAMEQEITGLEQKHQSNALNDYRMTKGKGHTRTPQLTAARERRESLKAAKTQAVKEIARQTKLAKKLAHLADLARARSIKEKRRPVCVEYQAHIEAAVLLAVEYRATAAQFRELTKDSGNQVCSLWRIENLIEEKLHGRAISKDLRITDLAEIDDRIFEGVLDRAVRALKKKRIRGSVVFLNYSQ